VGYHGQGTLNITAGGRVDSQGTKIGHEIGGVGTATVNGENSKWVAPGEFVIGAAGTGTLAITAGGRVEDTNGYINDASIVTVDGTSVDGISSAWIHSGNLTIADDESGTLNITRGGLVQNVDGIIGTSAEAGLADVNGANSRWVNSGVLTIGASPVDQNALRITNGGLVQSATGIVGDEFNEKGIVVVSDRDSQWINTGTLFLGRHGHGTLNISNGGLVQRGAALIGAFDSGRGSAFVDGTNSRWLTAELYVGAAGEATLNITAGGAVHSASSFIGVAPGVTFADPGEVTVAGNGSLWHVDGRLAIGGDPNTGLDSGRGTLRIQTGGTVTVAQDILLWDDDLLSLEGGTLSASEISFNGFGGFQWTSGTLRVGVYHRPLTTPSGGVLAPGNSAGSTFILGNYAQVAGARLEIEIGGTAQAFQYDVVSVTGNVALGGNLQLEMLDGFIPTAANRFTILDATGSITGTFANVASGQRLSTSDGLGSFIVNYGPGSPFSPNNIVLSSFLTTLRGDFNVDGTINALDIDLLAADAARVTSLDLDLYDLNGDGRVRFTVSPPGAPNASDSDVLIRDILDTQYGDADLDGQVFLSDLTRLATNYRQAGLFGWAQGNFNGSQEAGTSASPRVSLHDLSVLATNWRFGVGAGSAIGAAVPEPSGVLFALCVAFAVPTRRARR
jgi:T5SS/PEP-CTERM-associated repeat protein